MNFLKKIFLTFVFVFIMFISIESISAECYEIINNENGQKYYKYNLFSDYKCYEYKPKRDVKVVKPILLNYDDNKNTLDGICDNLRINLINQFGYNEYVYFQDGFFPSRCVLKVESYHGTAASTYEFYACRVYYEGGGKQFLKHFINLDPSRYAYCQEGYNLTTKNEDYTFMNNKFQINTPVCYTDVQQKMSVTVEPNADGTCPDGFIEEDNCVYFMCKKRCTGETDAVFYYLLDNSYNSYKINSMDFKLEKKDKIVCDGSNGSCELTDISNCYNSLNEEGLYTFNKVPDSMCYKNSIEEFHNFDENSVYSCGDNLLQDIPGSFIKIIHLIYFICQLLVPCLLVIFGSIDIVKSIISKSDDEIKKGQQIFIKRLFVGFIVFFIFSLVKLVVSIVNSDSERGIGKVLNCVSCFINSDDKCVSGGTND